MRDLREAAKEGRTALLHSLAHFPQRHPFLIAGAVGSIAIGLLALGLQETKSDVNVLKPQVTQIVKAAAACQPPVTAKRLPVCVARIEAGLETCRLDPDCREAFADVLRPPRTPSKLQIPPSSGVRKRGDASQQPSTTAPQQPRPPKGGQPGGKGKAPSKPGVSNPPSPSPSPSTVAPPGPTSPADEAPGQQKQPIREVAKAVDGAVKEVEKTVDDALKGATCPLLKNC